MNSARPAAYHGGLSSPRVGRAITSRRKPMVRNTKQIKEDRDNYLDLACLLRDIGDITGYKTYLEHVKAMDRELNLRRYGAANVI